MNESQALAILGLEEGASREDIVNAHRRLIQKVHPDRGGSTFLAARINEAKSLLIKLKDENDK
jgi:curved DNA-binding protein CbpA